MNHPFPRYDALEAMELAGLELGFDLGPAAWGMAQHLSTFKVSSSAATPASSSRRRLDEERERLMVHKMARLRMMTVDTLTVTSNRAVA